MSELHDFLVTQDGRIDERAEYIPQIRKAIQDLPETAATFKLRNICEIPESANIRTIHVEFCGAWPVSGEVTKPVTYVNPNYVHTHRYPSITVTCECGAKLAHLHDVSDSIEKSHEHSDECLRHHRLYARARLHEMRYNLIHRLTKLGWDGKDIAPRLGLHRNTSTRINQQYGLSFIELKKEYRRLAGNTYRYLLNCGVSASKIERIYGHDMSTLGRWDNQFTMVASD